MVKIGVSGAFGRMGRRIIHLGLADKQVKVMCGFECPGHPEEGKTVEGVPVYDNLDQLSSCDCLIEFSSSLATIEHLPAAIESKKCAIIGTTGLNDHERRAVEDAAKIIPVCYSPNMSVGVNLVFKLLKQAASTLKGYKVYVEEAHHIHKKDAPSGTAKRIADIINSQGFGLEYEDINAIREDEIVGDHRIVFESAVDKIEISHSAKTRDIFAQGAVIAAKWIVSKPAGLYSMADVLF